jgi:DNA polymerase III epsilon subunit-like protein
MSSDVTVGFDLETTGISTAKDKPVQACLVLRSQGTDRILMNTLVNPCMPIAPGATNVHHIGDHHVRNMPDYAMIAWQMKLLSEALGDFILVTFNGNSFDVPMINNCLGEPVFKVGHIDVLRFARHHFPQVKGSRSKGGQTLGELYEIFCGRPLEGAHDAAADVIGTLDLLDAMRKKSAMTLERLVEEQNTAKPYAIMPIGKHAGKMITDVPKSWAQWMVNNARENDSPLDCDLQATVDAILGIAR